MVAKKKPTPQVSENAPVPVAVPEDGIGDRIREARESMGLTQVGLATRTKLVDPNGEGVSRTVIIGYEAGTYKPGAREIRILCEALSITPNWLLYRQETPFEATQASMNFMRGTNDVTKAIRLAYAVLVLKPHERDLVGSLILSIAGRALGDARLSGLLIAAGLTADTVKKDLAKRGYGSISLEEVIEKMSREVSTNWGNKLRLDEEGNPIGGEWLYRDPEK